MRKEIKWRLELAEEVTKVFWTYYPNSFAVCTHEECIIYNIYWRYMMLKKWPVDNIYTYKRNYVIGRNHPIYSASNGKSGAFPPRPSWQSHQRNAKVGMGTQRHPPIQRRIHEFAGKTIFYVVDQRRVSGKWGESRRAGIDPNPLQYHIVYPWEFLITLNHL